MRYVSIATRLIKGSQATTDGLAAGRTAICEEYVSCPVGAFKAGGERL